MSTVADALAAVAERDNPRRRHLLVSPVLGKHVPVHPDVARLAGVALALLYAEDPRAAAATTALITRDAEAAGALLRDVDRRPADGGPVTVIGFAETATALGLAAGSALKGALALSTTRTEEPGWPRLLTFQEEHSHAPSHIIYAPGQAVSADTVLLVDDEVSTAQTAINLIAALRDRIPAQRYVLATLISGLGEAGRARVAEAGRALGVEITAVALSDAPTIDPEYHPATSLVVETATDATPAGGVRDVTVPCDGTVTDARRGLDRQGLTRLERLADQAADALGPHPPSRFLGVGEFMYLPLVVAARAGGPQARFWSTTRSPIRISDAPGYPVCAGISFAGPDFPDTRCYLYNFAPGPVCVVFGSAAQRAAAGPLLAALGADGVVCLTFTGGPA